MLLKEIYRDNEENIYRILWMDVNSDTVCVINLNKINTLPNRISYKVLSDQLIDGSCKVLPEQFNHRYLREDEIKEKDKIIRDRAWNVIKSIYNIEPQIYERKTRGKLIATCAQNNHVTRMAVTRYLYRFWQRGCVIHALLPDYNKCGASGQIKRVDPDIKRGRPRTNQNNKDIGIGINVDEKILEIFKKAYGKYYIKSKKNRIEYAYTQMLKEYFPDVIDTDGNKVPCLINKPTKNEFSYWLHKIHDDAALNRLREAERIYNLCKRELLQDSSIEASRPGQKFQIDASIFDIYLVALFNRMEIIGFPVVYLVKDVFSREYVGLHVGIEGLSYLGFAMAIYNTARDKVEFCKEFGIDINPTDWPCAVLPSTLFADNGIEYTGRNSDEFVRLLGINIENAPVGRGDLKSIIESSFNQIKGKVTPIVPGFVPDFDKRQGEKYKYDAKLTIKEFTAILIYQILAYNNSSWMKEYPMDEDIVKADIKPIPIELWNWGIEHRAGFIKKPDMDMVMLACMYSDIATVTEKGIRFKKRYYTCDKAFREDWFANARSRGYWKIDIAYDPRNLEKIYYKRENGFETCTVTVKGSNSAYENWVLEEIEYYEKMQKIEQDKYKSTYYDGQIKFLEESEKIIKNAEEQKKRIIPFDKRSKKEKFAIKPNKDAEKERLRAEQKFDIPDNKGSKVAQRKPPVKKDDNSKVSYFLKKQQERFMQEEDNKSPED